MSLGEETEGRVNKDRVPWLQYKDSMLPRASLLVVTQAQEEGLNSEDNKRNHLCRDSVVVKG